MKGGNLPRTMEGSNTNTIVKKREKWEKTGKLQTNKSTTSGREDTRNYGT